MSVLLLIRCLEMRSFLQQTDDLTLHLAPVLVGLLQLHHLLLQYHDPEFQTEPGRLQMDELVLELVVLQLQVGVLVQWVDDLMAMITQLVRAF